MPEDTPDLETLERRLAAVERAVGEDDDDTSRGNTADTLPTDRCTEAHTRLDDLHERVDELDAALQAVRGYLGGVDAVNEAVERRADAAVAGVKRLERRLGGDGAVATTPDEAADAPPADDTPEEPDRSLRERLRDLR